MRLIDADTLKKDLSENYVFYGFRQLLNDFYEALDSAPSIDIVRCGECKWFNEKYGSCHAYHWDLNQGLEYAEVDADDFCSYGQKGDENVETD